MRERFAVAACYTVFRTTAQLPVHTFLLFSIAPMMHPDVEKATV